MGSANTVKVARPAPLPIWKRFILFELMQGLRVTLAHFFENMHTTFTVQYPEERLPLAPRFRGYPRLRSHPETGEELCIGCLQCEKICPDECIRIEAEPHPSGKGKRARTFVIDYERCCLCGLCVDPCPTVPITAIYMSHDYEYAQYDRDRFSAKMKDLYVGLETLPYGKKK
jgi:NADH-quinone oxidoreductase subunit I